VDQTREPGGIEELAQRRKRQPCEAIVILVIPATLESHPSMHRVYGESQHEPCARDAQEQVAPFVPLGGESGISERQRQVEKQRREQDGKAGIAGGSHVGITRPGPSGGRTTRCGGPRRLPWSTASWRARRRGPPFHGRTPRPRPSGS